MVILATWPACPGGGQGQPRLANTWRAWAASADEDALGVFGFLAGDEHHRVLGRDDGMGVAGGACRVSGLMSSSVIGLSVLVRMAVGMW
jgi:hypothetical protein